MLEIIEGDITTLFNDRGVIIHQMNAQGVAGAGIAKTIVDAFPEHKEDYLEMCNSEYFKEPSKRLGQVIVTSTETVGLLGIVSQLNYGNSKKTGINYTDYDAMRKALGWIAGFEVTEEANVFIPEKIGADLAGGDSKIIHQIIEETLGNQRVYLVRYVAGKEIIL